MLAYGRAACELPIRATMPARKIARFFSFCGVFSVHPTNYTGNGETTPYTQPPECVVPP